MIVNMLASIGSSLSSAGIRTGGRFAGCSGGAGHFSFSERVYLPDIFLLEVDLQKAGFIVERDKSKTLRRLYQPNLRERLKASLSG